MRHAGAISEASGLFRRVEVTRSYKKLPQRPGVKPNSSHKPRVPTHPKPQALEKARTMMIDSTII
eukprot:1832878-Karenia_brevis.AAC.1